MGREVRTHLNNPNVIASGDNHLICIVEHVDTHTHKHTHYDIDKSQLGDTLSILTKQEGRTLWTWRTQTRRMRCDQDDDISTSHTCCPKGIGSTIQTDSNIQTSCLIWSECVNIDLHSHWFTQSGPLTNLQTQRKRTNTRIWTNSACVIVTRGESCWLTLVYYMFAVVSWCVNGRGVWHRIKSKRKSNRAEGCVYVCMLSP